MFRCFSCVPDCILVKRFPASSCQRVKPLSWTAHAPVEQHSCTVVPQALILLLNYPRNHRPGAISREGD